MRLSRRDLMISTSAAAFAVAVPRIATAKEGPPVPRIEPVTETFFGQSITDPYRWMENPKDKDWEPYMKAQAAYARSSLDAIPGRAALAKRVSELSGDLELVGSVERGGPYVVLERRPLGANSFQLYAREGIGGKERLLIDPEARTKGDVHYSLNYWSLSPKGTYIAYGTSPSGSENAVLEIMETATGKILAERIDRAQFASPSWLDDESGFYFNRLAEGGVPGSDNYYNDSVCWLHKIGTDPKDDVRVLSRGQFPEVALNPIDYPIVYGERHSRYVIGMVLSGVQNELTLFVNTTEAAQKGAGGWKKICGPEAKVTGSSIKGDDIYLLTFKDAPRYKILSVKADAPAIENAKVLVPEGATVIQSFVPAKDALYVQDLDGGIGRLRKVSADGKASSVKLPTDGTIIAIFANTEHDGALVSVQSWVNAPQILSVASSGAVSDTKLVAKPAIDVSHLASTRIFATAKDGTKVPVSIVYRKDMKRDGSAPAMIDAYGAYGSNSVAFFGSRFFAFVEKGGVWATAHVRGGGEYGRAWHEAGRLATKPNTWGDMIAAAEALIAGKWTSASKLAIRGGSAGGITVGRAMTDRPDLFAAVISQVGVSNNLRSEFSQSGPANIPEFGSVKTEDGFKGLYAMDSYQHVKDGVKYPAVMLTTGMTDPRVEPWQAGKMAARLQKASASGRPVLLRVDFQAGHGIGSTRQQRDEEFGDIFAFIFWQAGAAGFQPT
jgi:prolyl oligopeptidase